MIAALRLLDEAAADLVGPEEDLHRQHGGGIGEPPGGAAMKARMPIISSGAVSPSARAMPMIVPVRMPGSASGRTWWNTTWTGDAPTPSAASRIEGGTALIALRPAMTITGMVISASVRPPTSGAERGRPKRAEEHREAEQAEDDRGHRREIVDRDLDQVGPAVLRRIFLEIERRQHADREGEQPA